ncbi:MAG: nitroreductase family protein [Bacteroidota bacterium]
MTSTDLHHFLRTRRSVRRFEPQALPASVIERILTTATYAPSAHNRQPWRFCVITSAEAKCRLADAMAADFARDLAADGVPAEKIEAQVKRSRARLVGAPVAILLCADMSEMDSYPDAARAGAERAMALQSVAAAGTQLLLAAYAEGLGAVWVCSPLFAPATVRRTLHLPESWEPQAMFFIGFPAEVPEPRQRKLMQEVAMFVGGGAEE